MAYRIDRVVRTCSSIRTWITALSLCAMLGLPSACTPAPDITPSEAKAVADNAMGQYGVFPPFSTKVEKYEGSHNDCLDFISDPALIAVIALTPEAAAGMTEYMNRMKEKLRDRTYYLVDYNFTRKPNGKIGIGWNYCLFVDARTGVLIGHVER
ncbi:MAG TPA: hypothetical protein VMF53_08260 [Alphaproteobacteria bacterium]|nr:hypothetical protein [Alphaproteobacteria bacterium]